MYSAYFGLTENPFSLTPDPRFLFMSQRHREALAHLLFGMGERCGFVLLTGEVGTGKTTLCRSLLEQVPEGVEVALVLNPKQTALELVASLCDELKISYPSGTDSLKVLVDLLNRHLLEVHARGRRTVLIIDEAQNLSSDVLEQVRLLTNLETTTRKLLQILLIGQPELQTMMAQPELRQLSQRITARYHLTPLLPNETAAYIAHRLEVAGCNRRLFTKGSIRLVHRLSSGVPRLINTICDRALLGAYAKQRDKVNRRLVRRAALEVMGPSRKYRRVIGWAVALLAILILGVAWNYLGPPFTSDRPEVNEKNGKHLSAVTDLGHKRIPLKTQANREEQPPASVDDPAEIMDLLGTVGPTLDENAAFEILFRQWGIPYPASPRLTPCKRAEKAGLRCITGKGNWTTLCNLNRPAVLELVDEEQNHHYVPVVLVEGMEITLDLGDRQVRVDRACVEPFWFGDFTVLWRPPSLNAPVIKKGDSGPDVLWLRARLGSLKGHEQGLKPPSPSPLFDDALKDRVMEFQRAHFVKADGIVGEQTLIQLNTVKADDSVPLLCNRTRQGEKNVVDP